jgi:hypothetical protein
MGQAGGAETTISRRVDPDAYPDLAPSPPMFAVNIHGISNISKKQVQLAKSGRGSLHEEISSALIPADLTSQVRYVSQTSQSVRTDKPSRG